MILCREDERLFDTSHLKWRALLVAAGDVAFLSDMELCQQSLELHVRIIVDSATRSSIGIPPSISHSFCADWVFDLN